jgi:hypothetical protein
MVMVMWSRRGAAGAMAAAAATSAATVVASLKAQLVALDLERVDAGLRATSS